MTEMDFEELDKAVNSLMQQAGVASDNTKHTPVAPHSPKGVEKENPVAKEDKVSVKNDKPVATQQHVQESKPSSVASKRQRKFMDIVRPASSPAVTADTTLRASRQGVTVQPVSLRPVQQSSEQEAPSSEPEHKEPYDEVHQDFSFDSEPMTSGDIADKPLENAQSEDDKHVLPDPIDFMQGNHEQASGAPLATQLPDEPISKDDHDFDPTIRNAHEEIRSAQSSADIPLTSPFLPDAKVEKRPLGGLSLPEEIPAEPQASKDVVSDELTRKTSETNDSDESPLPEDDLQTPADPASSAQLPEEFSGAIMAIESATVPHAEERMDNVTNDPKPDQPDETVAKPTEKAPVSDEPKLADELNIDTDPLMDKEELVKEDEIMPFLDSASVEDDSAPKPSEAIIPPVSSEVDIKHGKRGWPKTIEPPKRPPVENGSILQQYTELQSSGSQENGAIYDTKSYHQPLEHPAKRTSSAVIVMWILVLLIIGALAGAAVFYFNTQ